MPHPLHDTIGNCGDRLGRPILLDLCCRAGGAAMGYFRAGFDVVGVDINPQPRYPFCFIQGDALAMDLSWADALHASPHCQGYSALRHAPGTIGKPQQIDQFREVLAATGLPYVIENVEAARWAMRDPVMLCGSMFGLGYDGYELQRHRLFESNMRIKAPACDHSGSPVIGIYGGHARCRSAKAGGRTTRDVWKDGHKVAASTALGIDWMTLGDLSEAIPPAYTEFLGRQLLAHMQQRRAA